MHFSKTYSALLLTLPPELRDNAIEYRQLKKLLNKVIHELEVLGLSPEILQEALESPGNSVHAIGEGQLKDVNKAISQVPISTTGPLQPSSWHIGGDGTSFLKAEYEFSTDSGRIAPRLRISVKSTGRLDALRDWEASTKAILNSGECVSSQPLEVVLIGSSERPNAEFTGTLPRPVAPPLPIEKDLESDVDEESLVSDEITREYPREIVIPLATDAEFFEQLSNALQTISSHLHTVHTGFTSSLEKLSADIALAARPASSTSTFHAHSRASSDATAIRIPSHALASSKSDLYSWREIFRLYMETEVFESVAESSRGARSIEDAEGRLALFAARLTQRGLGDERTLKQKGSRHALETFLQLNLFILNVKKFQHATAEATRKILKKHTKRTALPSPYSTSNTIATHSTYPSVFALIQRESNSLPRTLAQALSETLLPIIPHVDDYCCLICTSIAFKPIRLRCGHLFCVRCLVKMQKRGKENCPVCRAPTVLIADSSNVDWALVNFMQDWFPIEAKEKQKDNESEVVREQRQALAIYDERCIVA